jgi:hypothetical protein
MIPLADIARNLQRLRGEAASGRVFDEHGREVTPPKPEPVPQKPFNILDSLARNR